LLLFGRRHRDDCLRRLAVPTVQKNFRGLYAVPWVFAIEFSGEHFDRAFGM
jgi:hypothetical protein